MSLETLSDLQTPWCIHVVATLRIANHLAAGVTRIDALAAAAGCDAESLHTVLSHLVGRGVFVEIEPGQFALNALGQELLEPGRLIGLDLDRLGGRFALAWGTLLACVRTGVPAYHEQFGLPFWEDLDAHPEIGADFDALMGLVGHGVPDPDVLLAGDWSSVRTVVDVGGGTGALLAEILKSSPALRGTLVDLPRTVARSAELFQAAGVADRVTTVAQSFFDPLPAGADVYLLMKVLNDWPDREAAAILRSCADAARPNGRIVISGGVSADDAPRSMTLEMVLVGGATHRTIGAFRALARAAGLTVAQAGRLRSGRFAVECRPA